MEVSQLIHAMDRDDEIVIDDYDAPFDNMTIYKGAVRGIKKDNPINKMHIERVLAANDTIFVLAVKQRKRR